ncbi:MAG: hypothetical protein AABW49_01265 [Nanoarchaeota archaeon]
MGRSYTYILTKRIAKHGKQSIIVIPSFLSELKSKTLAEVKISILKGVEDGGL